MTKNLQIVTQFNTHEEAYLVQGQLEEAGIPAFLEGETMATHFFGAVGGVKVLVPEERMADARRVLAEYRELAHLSGPGGTNGSEADLDDGAERPLCWTCPHCETEVEVDLGVCWNCGVPLDDGPATRPQATGAQAGEPEEEEPAPPPPDVAFVVAIFPPALAYFYFTKFCALFGPLLPEVRHHGSPRGEALDCSTDLELEALAGRAWRAAVLGFCWIVPVLTTGYSMALLLRYQRRRAGRPQSSDGRAMAALGVNLFSLAVLLALGWVFVWAGLGPGDGSPSIGPTLPDLPGIPR